MDRAYYPSKLHSSLYDDYIRRQCLFFPRRPATLERMGSPTVRLSKVIRRDFAPTLIVVQTGHTPSYVEEERRQWRSKSTAEFNFRAKIGMVVRAPFDTEVMPSGEECIPVHFTLYFLMWFVILSGPLPLFFPDRL